MGSLFSLMYKLDDEEKIDEAIKVARGALKGSNKNEEKGDICVFLGEFEKAKQEYVLALESGEKGRSSYYRDEPETAYFYGSRWLDAEIQRIKNKIKCVIIRETPLYLRTLRRENRDSIKLVAFDLDGTLTDLTGFWEMIYEKFNLVEESKELAQRYYAGKLNYADWASKAIKLLFNHRIKEKDLYEAIGSVKLTPGALETISELKSRGKKVTMITGSLDIIVRKFFQPWHFDNIIINQINFKNDGSINGWSATYYGDGKYKAQGLEYLARKSGLRLRECAYIGDNSNDIEVAKVAGLSIAFEPKTDKFREVCDFSVEGDMRKILPYILNYGGKNGS